MLQQTIRQTRVILIGIVIVATLLIIAFIPLTIL